jgi:hypothetical protein|tara:strand:- start:64 stop:642 length:579 start_codon:yes stop_codon:yes gene_type:complete
MTTTTHTTKGPQVYKALKKLEMLYPSLDVHAYIAMADDSETRGEYIDKLIDFQDLNEEMEGYGFPTFAFAKLVFPEDLEVKLVDTICRHVKSTRTYTRLFPKTSIYREMNPKYIPLLAGQNPLGYGKAMQELISMFLMALKDENGGTLPTITSIGSYSATAGTCLVSFKNEGPDSPSSFKSDPFYKNDSYLD